MEQHVRHSPRRSKVIVAMLMTVRAAGAARIRAWMQDVLGVGLQN